VIRKYCYIASMAVYALKGTPSVPVIGHFEINLNKTTESRLMESKVCFIFDASYLGWEKG